MLSTSSKSSNLSAVHHMVTYQMQTSTTPIERKTFQIALLYPYWCLAVLRNIFSESISYTNISSETVYTVVYVKLSPQNNIFAEKQGVTDLCEEFCSESTMFPNLKT